MDAASTATDAVTHAGDLLPGTAPRIQQQLYRAFDLQALYNKNLHQVTIHVTITDSTPPPAPSPPSSPPPATPPQPAPQTPHGLIFRIWHKPLSAGYLPRSCK